MNISELRGSINLQNVGEQMYQLIGDLYPFCRSITGNGVRQTLKSIQRHVPLKVHEVPTGTQVFDWTVPQEWNIKDAYVKNSKGERVIDFSQSNLHVMSYSVPVSAKMSLKELKAHLFTLPDKPDWIPYRTSYYKENWGFCLTHNQFLKLKEDEYDVCIDSSVKAGYLTYGEAYIQGKSNDEVLVSCHVCHPSLCNDNLSGVALVTFLAKYLEPLSLEYSYRFLFIPVTIGSITWLSLNESKVTQIKHGLTVACAGDSGMPTYKRSRRSSADIDKAAINVLKHSGRRYEIIDFSPYGYDERQFCSPAFNLPVGCFMRTPHGQFTQYHTSADNLDFIRPDSLADSFFNCLSVFNVLENNKIYLNQNPKCEPQLGKRGLYRAIGGQATAESAELAMLWVLNLSDGAHSLLDISDRSGLAFDVIKKAADLLIEHDLLKEDARLQS